MPMKKDKKAAWFLQRYHQRQQAGLCVRCGSRRDSHSAQYCESCRVVKRRRDRELGARQKAGMMSTSRWRAVVRAKRDDSRGAGWWTIALACGHRALVLHGVDSPLGESAVCVRCEA